MKIIYSEAPEQCLAYSEIPALAGTHYGSLIKALVYTMKAAMPVEIMENETGHIIKGNLTGFSVTCQEGSEGTGDQLSLCYRQGEEQEIKVLNFEGLDRSQVVQDRKSSARTFYRYAVQAGRGKGYRLTFNRRISKVG